MRSTYEKTHTVSAAIPFVLFASLVAFSNAHQSISYPTPISFDLACRIGLGRNCPGPCPTRLLRKDQSPTKPSVTARRGGILPVHILKNNHVGGFARWSLVRISDMYSKRKHEEAAFLFTCADVQVTKCTRKNQERDCKVDRLNEYYRYNLRIPKVYPDGYYVLGWLWYGGLVSTGSHGAFGEYWDCVYIKIKGGPSDSEHQPIFHAGETMTGRNGMCRATTNRIGHCFREPCPFGNRAGVLMTPVEFKRGRPPKILWKDFESIGDKMYQTSLEGNQNFVETRDRHSNAQTSEEKHKEVFKQRPMSSQTGKMKQNFGVPTTGYTTNNMQNHGAEKFESLNGYATDASAYTGKKKILQNMEDQQPENIETKTVTANNLGQKDSKKVAKQRRLKKKKQRKERKSRKRREKQVRKAKARKEKLERKRLMRDRIKKERARKRERQRIQKQRMKEMKQGK